MLDVHRSGRTLVLILSLLLVSASALYADVLQYGDGQADAKRSIGGGGHLIMFDGGRDVVWLNKIEMRGSRYGSTMPPDEDFQVYIVDGAKTVLRKISLPYLLWERGEEYWRELPIPPTRVPQQFGIGFVFNAQQTKGVYVCADKGEGCHSYSWTPGSDARSMDDMDWMVKATVDAEPVGDPTAVDLVVMKNGDAFIDKFIGVAGEPMAVDTATHAQLSPADIASVRLNAASSPRAMPVCVILSNGMRVQCALISADEKAIRIRDSGDNERQFLRCDIARLEFN